MRYVFFKTRNKKRFDKLKEKDEFKQIVFISTLK